MKPSYEDFKTICKNIDQYYWKRHSLTVIRDGHDSNGKRYHVVQEQCCPDAVEIDNAWVISEVSHE